MRNKLFIVCLLSFLLLGCKEQDLIPENDDAGTETITQSQPGDEELFYYYFDEKIYLKQKTDMVFLKIASDVSKEQYQAITRRLVSLQTRSSDNEMRFTEDSSSNTIILESQSGKEISPNILESFRENKEIVSATYLLEYNESLSAITNEFAVKLKETATYSQLQELAAKNNCEINKHEWFDKNEFMISVPKSSDLDAIQMANLFYETKLFKFTSPNFVRFNAFSSNDTYYSNQWGLKNTGQYGGTSGLDINVEQAWTITSGSPNIKVAVLDVGVDLTHPDLQANLLPGYDATGQNTGGAPYYIEDNHGTAVAGIIGAIKDNGIGVSGVAPGCKIIPVRIGIGNSISDSWATAGFNWAWQNGADVINCSWGGGQPNAQLTTAIFNASSFYGRGGKGCVVVFSSGNENRSTVNYPAVLFNVISVGAITYNGYRKTPSTSDRENWGSNYGSTLDVVAPGVLVPTTDRQGSSGYNPNIAIHRQYGGNIIANDYANKDYTVWFGGTSAAAPHVSGIAALVLSQYPDLTSKQVQMVIEKSCSFLWSRYTGGYDPHDTNGIWNIEIGHGLVNAYQALQEAHKEMLLDIQRTIPAIDFRIINNIPDDLDKTYINLSGNVGGSYTTLIYHDPEMVWQGQTQEGFPYYPGNNLTAAPGTAITNLTLEFFASTWIDQIVEVVAYMENTTDYVYANVNFVGGKTVVMSLPNTTVPSASRRTLNILVRER